MEQLSRHFNEDELAPEDVVLHRVHAIVKEHPKMKAIFGSSWIKATDLPNELDFAHFPIFFVSPFYSSSDPETAS